MARVAILIPTYNRTTALAATLASLYAQTFHDFSIHISDQSDHNDTLTDNSIQTLIRLFENRGNAVRTFRNLPKHGMAQQRQFLLDTSDAPYSLFLDDDIFLEPFVVGNMVQALEETGIGFVGQAVIGLSFLSDFRPEEQAISLWDRQVQPEYIEPGSEKWQRHKLHNAANVYHVQQALQATPDRQLKYKIAWVGGCVMYDTEKLRNVGGFHFWQELPENHCGEDVLAELRVMEKYGGCGLLPSGAYHQELSTTIPDRRYNAPKMYHKRHETL